MTTAIETLIDLDKYPLGRPGSIEWNTLVAQCRRDLVDKGMYELPGFLKSDALHIALSAVSPYTRGEMRATIFFRQAAPK